MRRDAVSIHSENIYSWLPCVLGSGEVSRSNTQILDLVENAVQSRRGKS